MNLADAIRRAAQTSGAVLGKPEPGSSNRDFEPVQQAVTAEEFDLATPPAPEPAKKPAQKPAKEPTVSHSKHRNLSLEDAAGYEPEEHSAHPHNVVRLELVLNPEQLKGFFGAVTASQHSVLTLREAASFLRITPKALQGLAEEGEVPGLLVDGKWRFTRQGLDDWFSAHPKSKEA